MVQTSLSRHFTDFEQVGHSACRCVAGSQLLRYQSYHASWEETRYRGKSAGACRGHALYLLALMALAIQVQVTPNKPGQQK
jgi:hypothetical protein